MTGGLQKMLIANRGEIAVRVARAAKDRGIETVTVYSAGDRESRHALVGDQNVCIGPAAASESYLRGEVLIHTALSTNCDALHPGYGFLSENAEFAKKVSEAGLTWIGPTAETIARMGDKAEARRVAIAADVPVVPGSDGVLADAADFLEFGRRHGYPLLLKARAGGGGKGMRVVDHEDELPKVLSMAQQEAGGAFGDSGMYVERYLPKVRHVEVQVLGDHSGHAVAVGERDCSIQRRHQKLVEEAPGWNIPEQTRQEMSQTAVRLSETVGYVGAGTVEFLLDVETGKFYFIEMNTRIQVEHPVTEEVMNTDLIAWQLRLAAGELLEDVTFDMTGHAMEFRITAEDPHRNFAPNPGLLSAFTPPGGPGVRCDTHCFPGYVVPPYYDSLLAKLVVRGQDRDEVLRRSRRALAEFHIEGVATSLPFHRWLLSQREFVNGTHTTAYLADFNGIDKNTQEDSR